jgi:hypothetical protein
MAKRRDGGGSGPPIGNKHQKLTPLIVDATGKGIYDPERHCRLVRALALTGAIDSEIAETLGWSTRHYYHMRELHPELDRAIRLAKLPADAEVAESVYRVATGYRKIEQRAVVTAKGKIEVVDCVVDVGPDGRTGLQWLRQRRPRDWSEPRTTDDVVDDPSPAMAALTALIGAPLRQIAAPKELNDDDAHSA